VSERQQLLDMLEHATGKASWHHLEVTENGQAVNVHTGPDDAIAVFGFDAEGNLVTVSVDES
jgi:hypothetical protein